MFRLFIVVTLIALAFIDVNASDLHIDITHINGKQIILIEKNGITTIVPASDIDLEDSDAITKKVCSVLKCKDQH